MKSLAIFSVCALNFIMGYGQTINLDRTIKIPIIFHVIYSNRSERSFQKGQNPEQNLPIEALLCELQDLHNDFLLLNSDASQVLSVYRDRIANPRIDFYLADTVLQVGGEKGIIRIKTSRNKSRLFKRSQNINPSKYLNIYIGDIPGSYLPSGTPWTEGERDAVSLEYKWIGQGYRLLTHEVGHWLGLLHLWGTGTEKGDKDSCLAGDGIDDTPSQREATDMKVDCESCPPPFGDLIDKSCYPAVPANYNNFMDYSGCRKMFTLGQVIQMRKNLRDHRLDMWGRE